MQSVFKNCIQGQLIYNVVLISAVQQVDLYICIPSYSFPWRLTTEYWIYVPMLYSQFSSVAQLCPALWDPVDCSTPGFLVHHQLPEPPQTHVHRVGDAIQPSHPLSSSSPPDFNFPSTGVFSNESILLIRYPKDWSFSFSISLSNEFSWLISFRMDWLDLLAVQGTLSKTLLQHHSSKASILWLSAFYMCSTIGPCLSILYRIACIC